MRQKHRTYLLALCLTAALALPVSAAQVAVNGTTLSPQQGWVEGGSSLVTLRSLSQTAGYELSWDGQSACLTGPDFTLIATPGQEYIQINDRYLYLPGGAQCPQGQIVLPLSLLAQALNCPLTWDGTTAALDTTSAAPAQAEYDPQELDWLARIISAESRGECLEGQIAVGNVVLNRVKSPLFPNTVREVVLDDCYAVQFEPVSNGTIDQEPTQLSLIAAKLCLEGANTAGDSLYFFAPALSSGSWIRSSRTFYTAIGCHHFYL